MSKFNFDSTLNKVQESFKKDKRRASQMGLGTSLADISTDPSDYVILPDWWHEHFGIPGLQFGKIVQIAGDSDTGKTSLALVAIKAAQEQGYGIIYVETEGKTGPADLVNAGIDPNGVMTVHSAITEEAFDGALRCWDAFFNDFPNEKLLLVYDSYGNTVSQRDSALDLTSESQKPGGAAKTNRMGINTMIARMQKDPVAVLVINYTYDNIGTVGKVNAGGKALNFFAMLTLQAQRTGWVDVTRQGKKVRLGAQVKWRVFKNHYSKALKDSEGNQILLPSEINLTITGEGFKLLEKKEKK